MTNIPAKLIAEFATLTGRIEEAVRQDERQKLLQRMAAEYQDRNGETSSLNLGDSAAKKLRQRRGFHSGSKLGKLYRCLAYRSYAVTKNTLCRESGMTPLSVYKGIQTLRRKGYNIQTVAGHGIKRRYKLAS
jgi:biotin operon repressor